MAEWTTTLVGMDIATASLLSLDGKSSFLFLWFSVEVDLLISSSLGSLMRRFSDCVADYLPLLESDLFDFSASPGPASFDD